MNREDRVLPIVLAAEHLLDLAGLHRFVERGKPANEVGVHVFAGLAPLDEHREIVRLLSKQLDEIEILLQASPALQDALRLGLVFPEIGRGGARLETIQLRDRLSRLKDSSTGW